MATTGSTALANWALGCASSVKRPDRLTVSEWSEKNLVLSERSTASPGLFRLDRSPYTREILDALTDPFVESITWMSGAQVAKTMTVMAMLVYAIDQDPGPALMVMPNSDLCRSFSEQRLQPLIDDCPALARHKPEDPKKYRMQEIFFDRMQLALVGSNSPANLASRPVRYLFLDEVDKYPGATAREAGAVDLAMKRTRTFWNRKIVLTSTPTTVEGAIYLSFVKGDRRYYWVPCPHCSEMQKLSLGQIKWPNAAKHGTQWDLEHVRKKAHYECEHCAGVILDKHKKSMLLAGEWRMEGEPSRHRSYQLSALYALWMKFGDIAAHFLESKDYPDKLRDFVNNTLGEPWEERGDAATESELVQRIDPGAKPGTCPERPLCVVMTVDVQKDRCYYVIRAWCEDETSWLLRYGTVPTLEAAERMAGSVFRCAGEDARIGWKLIDSGYNTEEVYKFCLKRGWVPTKGHEAGKLRDSYRWSDVEIEFGRKLKLLSMSSDHFKEYLQQKIKVKDGDPGAWNLHNETGNDYFRQITAETPITERDKKWGRPKTKWKLVHPDNHYLDCEVMQLAAALSAAFRDMRLPSVPDKNTKKAKPVESPGIMSPATIRRRCCASLRR